MNKLQNQLSVLTDPAANGAELALGVREARTVGDTEVRVRGEAEKLGQSVPRGFLKIVEFPSQPKVNPKQSGRLELAQWLTSEKTPLTSRVMANRVWQHLFGQGFVRSVDNFGYYGFLDAMTDQYHPELVQDNTRIDPPNRPGYHLTKDLVDHTIQFVRSQTAAAADKPFFAYLALGTAHAPHQAPGSTSTSTCPSSRRAGTGPRRAVQPSEATGHHPVGHGAAAPQPRGQTVGQPQHQGEGLAVQLQAAFAGFLDHADVQIGRLVEFLAQVGRFDNTIFVVASDNGASQEGGLKGTLNGIGSLSHIPESVAENHKRLSDIGTDRSFSNYPLGWASVGNTPFRFYKTHPFGGGNNDPLIISWPKRIADKGAIRPQFVDVIDITPTILDVVGIAAPKVYRGVPQKPLEGTSVAATFARADAPSPRTTQYFELHGNRAIWHDGWKAVAVHQSGADFDNDRWQLFNLKEDFGVATRPKRTRGRWRS